MTGIFGVSACQQTSHAFQSVKTRPEEETAAKNEKIREMLRALKRNQTSEDKQKNFTELYGASTRKEEKTEKPAKKYQYREVETKILRAKTALSAGQAVIAAKRKVLEVKRMLSSAKGDPEELEFALTHAKRMELVARKKKHHLELEELAENTRKRDEREEAEEEASAGMKNALVETEEDRVTAREDEIFEEREEQAEELVSELEESGAELSEESMGSLNEMIAEFGEEELKMLEEAMEMLESLEFIDPHMSEEELEELKRKHRAAEQKAIVKADMDYLKSTIRHQLEKGENLSGIHMGVSAGFGFGAGAATEAPAMMTGGGSGVVDIQI